LLLGAEETKAIQIDSLVFASSRRTKDVDGEKGMQNFDNKVLRGISSCIIHQKTCALWPFVEVNLLAFTTHIG